MINDDIDFFGGNPNKACRAYSDPLFLQDSYLSYGHNKSVRNGTATFVGYRKRVYACTCRHVSDAIADPSIVQGRNPSAQLMLDKVVLNLSCLTADGRRSSLRPVGEGIGQHRADVSIVALPPHIWQMLMDKKQKAAIDLDAWQPPPWDLVTRCFAAGYGDEHKSEDGGNVVVPMLSIGVDLASALSDDNREFTLRGTTPEPHGYFFSGTSGGPILATWDDGRFRPIGMIFEGAPSSRSAPSYWAQPNDIFIRGLLLTPQRFEEWLANREETE